MKSGIGVRADLVEQLLRHTGRLCGPSVGHSMWPSLRRGDRLIIEVVSDAEECVAQIVLFRVGDRLLLHRLLKHEKKVLASQNCEVTLVTKGDACRHSDPPISRSQLLGRLVAIERGSRRIDLTSALRVRQAHFLRSLSASGIWWFYLISAVRHWRSPRALLRRVVPSLL